ncbi:TonB-linked SusC/RagA family outer membrane protein [Pedobacter nutrimenti]|uniref:TonB-linked SusC/RagA family outer membrane protein n=2 Tax=Pedobacter nutrimenti TaxID=1241337 RepID=A0A318UEH1_9SPHI|nr:TonB-linked SusC/RagA family outer membrane protein [Pedobacter nutrimenti]
MKCVQKNKRSFYINRDGLPDCKRMFLILLLMMTSSISLFAQKQIKGIVKEQGGGILPGVTLQIKNTKNVFRTDSLGRFSVSASSDAVLVFSYVGFTTQEIRVGDQSQLTVILMPSESNQLEQVVVVGYGKQKMPTVTGSVSVIAGKDLVQTPVANVTNMLVGTVPGLSGLQSSGEPGQNATSIRIRGTATLNGSNALVVIDGIQQPAENPFMMLNAIDANDIENISILKDASATAVYGIRGANGVIIVTTKRGKIGKPTFNFSASQGFTRPTSLMPLSNSYDFVSARNESIKREIAGGVTVNSNLLFSDDELWKFKNNRDYTPAQVDAMTNLTAAQREALKNSPALYYTSQDFYKALFSATGLQKQSNISVSGGTEKLRYSSSVGYFDQTGILGYTKFAGADVGSKQTRYNFRNNLDINIVKNLQLSFNLSGQFIRNKFANPKDDVGADVDPGNLAARYRGLMQRIYQTPFISPGIVDGKMVLYFVGDDLSATNPVGGKRGGNAGRPTQTWDPLNVVGKGYGLAFGTNISTQAVLKHTMDYLTKGLSSHFTVAYDDSYTKGFNVFQSIPTYIAYRDPVNPNNINYIGGTVGTNYSYEDYKYLSGWRKTYFEGGFDYARSFGSHYVTALILGNAQKYVDRDLPFNTPSGLMGLVGRATYNFKERYLLEGSVGYNGTENFAPGKRFGFFPAVAAGWIISNEPFFKQNKWISFAKLRGSYGEVGNDQISSDGRARRYLYLDNSWTLNGGGQYYFGNTDGSSTNPAIPGAAESSLGNPLVTWERAKKMNLQLDLNFLSNRLSFSGAYFSEKRNNILVIPGIIPATFGVSGTPVSNSGKVSNKGIELELGWNDKITQAFTYFVKGSFSYARNKIDYMAEAPFPYPWMDQTGFMIGQPKGLIADGFYNTKEELANRPLYQAKTELGDLRYRDINGDGVINDQDRVPIGYPSFPLIQYNWRVGFSYKGFDVSALFIGTAKGSYNTLNTVYANGALIQAATQGRWTQEKYNNGEKITYPAFNDIGKPSAASAGELSTFWLQSTDFVRLKNASIAYTFKSEHLQRRLGITGITLTATGNNLLTWTKLLKGIDPESANANGPYIFPLTKTYNLGLNVSF